MARSALVLTLLGLVGLAFAIAHAAHFSSWSPAINLEAVDGAPVDANTSASDGCPTPSRDGLRLYIASARVGPGSQGGQDIWVAERESTEEPFGSPMNLGAQINTPWNEFCPSPMRDGHGFMFVSNRPDPNGCGGDDIYVTRFHPNTGWATPVNLGCVVNSRANEASPFLVEEDSGATWLYFSSNRTGGSFPDAGPITGDVDLYVSLVNADGSYEQPESIDDVNTPQDDARPNVRRDNLELFFDSNRPDPSALGGNDIWTATRPSTSDPWSAATNLGQDVNSSASETRPSLSWGGTILYFGSTRPGSEPGPGAVPSQDVYFTTRLKLTGAQR